VRTLYEQQQRPHRYSPCYEDDGRLAAAVLLAPQSALVNATLPPEDSHIVFAPLRVDCDKGVHWPRQHL